MRARRHHTCPISHSQKRPSTQCHTNTCGSTGQRTQTCRSVLSPAHATPALLQPHSPFTRRPIALSPRQGVTGHLMNAPLQWLCPPRPMHAPLSHPPGSPHPLLLRLGNPLSMPPPRSYRPHVTSPVSVQAPQIHGGASCAAAHILTHCTIGPRPVWTQPIHREGSAATIIQVYPSNSPVETGTNQDTL